MKAIILAAGRGSRMKSMTNDMPKCLVPLKNRPLLDWQISALREAGIAEIAIVTGYRREMLAGYGLVEFHNPRWAETNMVSSLACAGEWLASGPVIVSYSDIFYEASAPALLSSCPDDLAITYDPNWKRLWQERFADPLDDAETFRLARGGYLAEIGGKPTQISEIEGQYMGVLRFGPAAWEEVERVRAEIDQPARDRLHCTGLLQKIITRGSLPIRALAYEGQWGEIDSETDWSLYETQWNPPNGR